MEKNRILFFKISLIIYILTTICKSSLIVEELMPYSFFSAIGLVGCLLSMLSIAVDKKQNYILLKLVLFISALYVNYMTENNLIPAILLIIAGSNIKFDLILKWMFLPMLIGLLIPWLLSSIGVLSNIVFTKELPFGVLSYKFAPQGLGFLYFSGFSYLAMGILMIHAYLRPKITFSYCIFLLGLSVGVFLLTVTRLQLLMNVSFVVLLYIGQHVPRNMLHNKFIENLSLLIYPLCLFITLATVFFPLFFSKYQEELNTYSSARYALNILAFERYPITIWGNKIEASNGVTEDYFFIDSGYVYSILGYGLALSAYIIVIYCMMCYKSYLKYKWKLLIWIMLFALANISNNFLFSIINCPFLMLTFSKKYTKNE